MARNKVITANGVKFTVRDLTFEELVNLGEKDITNKDMRDVVNEVISRCLISPPPKKINVATLDQPTVIKLTTEVLRLTRGNIKKSEFIPPMDWGAPALDR